MSRRRSGMAPRLWWLLVATFLLVAFAEQLDGAEEAGQDQGGHSLGSAPTLRMIRTTQRQRKLWRPYRVGSFSALSRGLMKAVMPPPGKKDGSGPRPARETEGSGPPLPETAPRRAKGSGIFPVAA